MTAPRPRGRPLGDHAARRREVAEATWRVISGQGLEGATLRAIAREAGCTTGVLTHYFEDKDELLVFAVALVFEGLEARMVEAASGHTAPDSCSGPSRCSTWSSSAI